MTETEAEAIRLLRELVQQIEINDFKESLGGIDAHLLRPFMEAQRFLAAHAPPRP